ncbi:MAG: HlyD family secretion protein [Microscillaceae bacterium]|jgi:multidrug resistance efflux pump|nr:HlyD family secretion protein [Microscillaceae bacterium]
MLEISNVKLDPKALEKKIYSLKTINAPRSGRVLAYWLVGIIFVLFICLFLPWQQNIEGTGAVTAFAPQDRPQEVHTAIAGRIVAWRVREGQFVNRGDTLMIIEEIKDDYFDPELLKRTDEQLKAKVDNIDAKNMKISALERQVNALQSGLQFKLNQTRNKYIQAQAKLAADKADYEAEQYNLQFYERQMRSYDSLYYAKPVPLISQTDWEKRRAYLQEVRAKITEKQNKVFVAEQELINTQIELSSVEAEYRDKIAKSESDRSATAAEVAESQADLSKLKNKYANLQVRTTNYIIRAPQDGYVVKALKSGVGETIKETDAICTIQPNEPQVATELYVKAMDVPLLSKGRKVRLEFDGWPALQVTGWPSVAVGTFGGVVQVIDMVDSKEGKYRLLVVPDKDEPWPKQLRQGSGVYGWVMLDDVPVWYEIWRQLNGFPPSLYDEPNPEDEKEKKSDKKIKIKVKK